MSGIKNVNLTDMDVCESFPASYQVKETYSTALEFINSKHDFSLLKFRQLSESLVSILIDKYKLTSEVNGLSLYDKIRKLENYDCICSVMSSHLHKIRTATNRGVHFTPLKKAQIEGLPVELVLNKREELFSVRDLSANLLLFVYCEITDINKDYIMYELVEVPQFDVKEIIYQATFSTCFKTKLHAALHLESIYDDYVLRSKSNIVNYIHEEWCYKGNLAKTIENIYKSAVFMSTQNSPLFEEDYDVIFEGANEECLYYYAKFLYRFYNEDSPMPEHGYSICEMLELAIDRGQLNAMVELGKIYLDKKDLKVGLSLLNKARDMGSLDATVELGWFYLDKDIRKSESYLKLAIDNGSVESKFFLGVLMLKNRTRVDEACRLIGQSAEEGFSTAKEFVSKLESGEFIIPSLLTQEGVERIAQDVLYFLEKNNLNTSEFIQSLIGKDHTSICYVLDDFISLDKSKIPSLASKLELFVKMQAIDFSAKPQPTVSKNKKLNPNSPCPCGSGKKYKKCCRLLH